MMTTKKEIRRIVRERKAEYDDRELALMSVDIVGRLMSVDIVRSARTLLLYWSLADEVYTHSLIKQLVSEGKSVLLPRVVGDTEMTIHSFSSIKDMSLGRYDILEPTNSPLTKEEATAQLKADAVAVVPGMAFDDEGHRVGRGKGYYDRLLSHYPQLYRIGLCFDFQRFRQVPFDQNDVCMHRVVS